MYKSIMEIQGGDRLSNGLNYKGNKSFRLININERLHKGEILNMVWQKKQFKEILMT